MEFGVAGFLCQLRDDTLVSTSCMRQLRRGVKCSRFPKPLFTTDIGKHKLIAFVLQLVLTRTIKVYLKNKILISLLVFMSIRFTLTELLRLQVLSLYTHNSDYYNSKYKWCIFTISQCSVISGLRYKKTNLIKIYWSTINRSTIVYLLSLYRL